MPGDIDVVGLEDRRGVGNRTHGGVTRRALELSQPTAGSASGWVMLMSVRALHRRGDLQSRIRVAGAMTFCRHGLAVMLVPLLSLSRQVKGMQQAAALEGDNGKHKQDGPASCHS